MGAIDLKSGCVALKRCPQYEQDKLAGAIDEIFYTIFQSRRWSSSYVLLKPNLISASHGPLACTESRFLIAVARWFIDQGARVSLGDSPAFGNSFSVLKRLGLIDALNKLGVRVCRLDRVKHVSLESGVKVGLAVQALEADLLVNLPRVKAHSQLRLTLAVKNYFGCLTGIRKPVWHMRYGGRHGLFADLLVELLPFFPESLSLVDGISAMHKTGPINGEEYKLGLIAGGTNPVAVDTALMAILGVDPYSCPLWRVCEKKGLGGVYLDSLFFPLQSPDELRVSDFLVPEELAPIRFDLLRFAVNSVKRLFY